MGGIFPRTLALTLTVQKLKQKKKSAVFITPYIRHYEAVKRTWSCLDVHVQFKCGGGGSPLKIINNVLKPLIDIKKKRGDNLQ